MHRPFPRDYNNCTLEKNLFVDKIFKIYEI